MIPAATPAMDLDALVIGRAGMDLYPRPIGTKTKDAETFFADMGGSAGNIAAAMASLGMKVALAAPVSDDPVGRFVARRLASLGIEHVTPEPVEGSARTSLALAETIAEGSETIIYRNGAADFELQGADLARHTSRARTVIATGTALAQEPSRGATLKALADAAFAVLDLDYRPYSWASLDEARLVYAEAAEKADLVVGN
ncbi:MAG: PfkB family carbohydrate kinase, partial [Pseudomonadota bacterium]